MRVRWAPRSMTSGTREIRCSAPAATPRALAAQAADHGAQVVRARAGPDGGAVVLEDSTRLEGDVVVWACGPWLGRMFPDLVSLSVTRQELLFSTAAPHGARPVCQVGVSTKPTSKTLSQDRLECQLPPTLPRGPLRCLFGQQKAPVSEGFLLCAWQDSNL